jgi:hypothetical protein
MQREKIGTGMRDWLALLSLTAVILIPACGGGQDSADAQVGSVDTLATSALRIQFIGNASFAMSDGETTLVTDLPYRSGASGYMTYDLGDFDPVGRVVALITHRHADHFEPALFVRQSWQAIGPFEVTGGLPAERVIPLTDTVEVGNFRIATYPTPHGDTEHYSYLVMWDGRRLYFTGDTDDPSYLSQMNDLDVAFVTPWLLCATAERAGTVAAEQLILQHHHLDMRDSTCLEHRVLAQGEVMELASRTR